jgi:hypothetical protein
MISFIPQATGATAVSLWICNTGLMNECKNAPSSRYCHSHGKEHQVSM